MDSIAALAASVHSRVSCLLSLQSATRASLWPAIQGQ